jgi:hypothetical protein
MNRSLARTMAEGLAWSRVALGATAIVLPSIPLRPWVGRDEAWRPRSRLLARSLGGRDVALGLGVVMAIRKKSPVRGWVEAGGVADAGDVLATLLAFPSLPKRGRMMVLGAAGGAVAVARLTAPSVDS